MAAETSTPKATCLYLPHGGGPMPLLGDPGHQGMVDFLQGPGRDLLNPRPKAILIVTAHWETEDPTVSVGAENKLYYDYYGFPPQAYDVSFPAKGDPATAERAAQLLTDAGFKAQRDLARGWDHGTFVPLKIYLPDYEIPIVQMSVLTSQDPKLHYKVGQALRRLRDEGVAIIGSGMSYHGRFQDKPNFNRPFDEALDKACAIADDEKRAEAFAGWESWPGARQAHPPKAAEHFMPGIVCAGAGGNAPGKRVLTTQLFNALVGAWAW